VIDDDTAHAPEVGNRHHTCYDIDMVALPQNRMTADEFLVWSEAQPKEAGKFELWDGQIVMIDGPTGQQSERSQHWEAKGAVYRALHAAIKRAKLPCFVAIEGPTVRLSTGPVVEPDVLVYCGPRVPRDAIDVPNPIIVVEVLSPSTARHDTSTKLQAYLHHASIRHYLIVDVEKPLVIHHEKGDADRWLTRIISAGSLRLDPPGLDVDLTELFEGA
jgi:Uma2 family endonuclease